MTDETCMHDDFDFPNTCIYKRDLRRFFVSLREQAHPIYALLNGAPKTVFGIVMDNDDPECEEQTYSLKEFYANLGVFDDRKDTFLVYFNAYFFREEWDKCFPCWDVMDNPFNGEAKNEIVSTEELTVAGFGKEYLHLLAYLCRQQIYGNNPLRFTRATISHYRFTREDVKFLREPVTRINERIIAELRAQYDALAAIDCLHEATKAMRKKRSASAPPAVSSAGAEKRSPRKRIIRTVPKLNSKK